MTEELKDKDSKCIDCQELYTFTVGEQVFFQRNGYQIPKRCKPCRKKMTLKMDEIRAKATK